MSFRDRDPREGKTYGGSRDRHFRLATLEFFAAGLEPVHWSALREYWGGQHAGPPAAAKAALRSLEGGAAVGSTAHCTPAHLGALLSWLQRRPQGFGSEATFAQVDNEFHEQYAQLAGQSDADEPATQPPAVVVAPLTPAPADAPTGAQLTPAERAVLRRVLRRRAEEEPPSPCWQALAARLGPRLHAQPAELIEEAIESFRTFADGGQTQGVVLHCPVAHSILRCVSSAANELTAPHIAHDDLVAAIKRGLQWERQQQAQGAGTAKPAPAPLAHLFNVRAADPLAASKQIVLLEAGWAMDCRRTCRPREAPPPCVAAAAFTFGRVGDSGKGRPAKHLLQGLDVPVGNARAAGALQETRRILKHRPRAAELQAQLDRLKAELLGAHAATEAAVAAAAEAQQVRQQHEHELQVELQEWKQRAEAAEVQLAAAWQQKEQEQQAQQPALGGAGGSSKPRRRAYWILPCA